jgi:hypothetical protein
MRPPLEDDMNHVDAMIRAAIANGELDDLPFKGEPIPFESDREVPEELRMTHRVLKNAGYVPGEVTAMKEVEALRAELQTATGEEHGRLVREINAKKAWLNARLERIGRMR